MNKHGSPSPLYQWLLNHGYTQTTLRKQFGKPKQIAPLARTLLPKIMKDMIVNKNGKPIERVQQVVEALCQIRSKSTRVPFRRHRKIFSTTTTVEKPTQTPLPEVAFSETIVIKGDLQQALDDLLNAAGNVDMLARKIQEDYDRLRATIHALSVS